MFNWLQKWFHIKYSEMPCWGCGAVPYYNVRGKLRWDNHTEDCEYLIYLSMQEAYSYI